MDPRAIRVLHSVLMCLVKARDAPNTLVPAAVEEHRYIVFDSLTMNAVQNPQVAARVVSKIKNYGFQIFTRKIVF